MIKGKLHSESIYLSYMAMECPFLIHIMCIVYVDAYFVVITSVFGGVIVTDHFSFTCCIFALFFIVLCLVPSFFSYSLLTIHCHGYLPLL